MRKSREDKQESLPSKIDGEDALLQSGKGRHWQRIIADFCHDEALRMARLVGVFWIAYWEIDT